MKKIFFVHLMLIAFTMADAQDTGIQFTHAANWQDVLAKARKKNKYILLDAYATWCGPCKYMSEKIFPQQEAGSYFNQRFINVKVQMDRTKADPAEIKQWYKDASMLTEKYSVDAYPTYIIFSPEGKALHRIVGTTKTAADFIAKAQNAFEPSKQYYTVVGQYKQHKGDSAFLRNAIQVAFDNSDRLSASAIGNEYIKCLKDPYAKENLVTISLITLSSKDLGFNMFLKHPEKVDGILGKDASLGLISGIMYEEELKPYFKGDKKMNDWKALSNKIRSKYPIITEEKMAFYELHFYRLKKNIPAYEKAVMDYVNAYGDKMSYYDLNGNAWDVFQSSDNKEVLKEALKWCKKALEDVPKDPGSDYVNYLDTYANLLYKIGNKDEAMKTERQVIDIATKDGKTKIIKIGNETLAKMEKGEKTWE